MPKPKPLPPFYRFRPILYGFRPILKSLCPACGRPWPEDLERYTLRREEGQVVFCPRCGHEWGVAHAA